MTPPPRILSLLVGLAVATTACGGGSSSDADAGSATNIVIQGEETLDISPTTEAAPPPEDGAGGAAESGGPEFDVTEGTIPTGEEEDPESEFFGAVGSFMECLSTEGYSFIGIPSEEGDPTLPVNDPGYRSALGTCAASSQIINKMRAAEDNSDLTAEEVEARNRAFAVTVDCMTGRGWGIPPLTPDENGLLQPGYFDIVRTWTPPDGSDILADGTLNLDDFVDCQFNVDELPE